MDQEEIIDEKEEEKRVEDERKKIKESGLEGASLSAFGNITSLNQKEHHKKKEEEQKSKKFVGFG